MTKNYLSDVILLHGGEWLNQTCKQILLQTDLNSVRIHASTRKEHSEYDLVSSSICTRSILMRKPTCYKVVKYFQHLTQMKTSWPFPVAKIIAGEGVCISGLWHYKFSSLSLLSLLPPTILVAVGGYRRKFKTNKESPVSPSFMCIYLPFIFVFC